MSAFKSFITRSILSEVPPGGIHFLELLRRLRSKGVLSSDRTLKRYLDHLLAEDYLKMEMVESSAPIPKKLFLKTDRGIETSTSVKAQVEGEVLAKVVSALLMEHYGDEIKKIFVFGSVASGRAGESSDVDLLVVVRDDTNWYALTKEFYGRVNPIVFEVGRFISLHVYPENEIRQLRKEGSRFLREVLKNGTLLYDSGKTGGSASSESHAET